MQIFLIGSVFDTAAALDARRLNKQIVEAGQIINILQYPETLKVPWRNHPVVKMYANHVPFLRLYREALLTYKSGDLKKARQKAKLADALKPNFCSDFLYDQMKRRLYTKDPEFYKQWRLYGKSEVNFYYVDGCWRFYSNGKLLNY